MGTRPTMTFTTIEIFGIRFSVQALTRFTECVVRLALDLCCFVKHSLTPFMSRLLVSIDLIVPVVSTRKIRTPKQFS